MGRDFLGGQLAEDAEEPDKTRPGRHALEALGNRAGGVARFDVPRNVRTIGRLCSRRFRLVVLRVVPPGWRLSPPEMQLVQNAVPRDRCEKGAELGGGVRARLPLVPFEPAKQI